MVNKNYLWWGTSILSISFYCKPAAIYMIIIAKGPGVARGEKK